jgi:hypothetical protein
MLDSYARETKWGFTMEGEETADYGVSCQKSVCGNYVRNVLKKCASCVQCLKDYCKNLKNCYCDLLLLESRGPQ